MSTRTRPAALDGHSAEADAAASRETKAALKVALLGILRDFAGLTDDALVEAYTRRCRHYPDIPRVSPQRVRSARAELARAGHVVASPVAGRSALGNRATVWHLADLRGAK